MKLTPYLIAAAACAVGLAAPGQAATVVKTFQLDAVYSASAPQATITGKFSITFDDSANVQPTSIGLVVSDFNFTPTNPLKFAYYKSSNVLSIGSDAYVGGFGRNGQRDDIGFFYSMATDQVSSLDYNVKGKFASSTSLTVTPLTAGVPEPATWGMMVLGFGAIGGALRVRRRTLAYT